MNFRFTAVETSLNRAEFRLKWLRLLIGVSVLGTAVSLFVLGLGVAVLKGWVTSTSSAWVFLIALGATGFVAGLVILIAVMGGNPEPQQLASAIERTDPRLLDRLHTLLFLETRRGDPQAKLFSIRIARQLAGILAAGESPTAFASTRAVICGLACLVAVAVTGVVYVVYAPWGRLVALEKTRLAKVATAPKSLELALPGTNSVEENQFWGEVRIVEPGADLKVTKVDVVPLQIEAAANQTLKSAGWVSMVNGAEEVSHELPPPHEPRYAVYQPTVYLDEMRLSDWDVMTYYAKASTDKKASYASEVYFLEVRPFREDILKTPGGEKGKAYQALNELSALINRQQHVIRQTHQHLQKPPEPEALRTQDRGKLSAAEADLRDSASHLYAQMAAGMENQPIGEALDNLTKAGKSLDKASDLLGSNTMPEAQNNERRALSELVAARKMFQKSLSEHPDAFREPQPEEEKSPVADSSRKLSQMAEFRNEARVAQDFIKKGLEQQKNIEQRVRAVSRAEYPNLADKENQLQKSVEDFRSLHPGVFKGIENESARAGEAMSKAADALQQKSNDAAPAMQQATRQMEKLSQSLEDQTAGRQLADAYRLKQMLDRQIQTIDERAKTNSTVSDATLQRTAAAARETIDQLSRAAEQDPTKDAFGQPLRDALSGQNKVDLQAQLKQLQQAEDEAAKRLCAGEARDGLSRVSKAFEESQPKSFQMAQRNDSLASGDEDAFTEGMAELNSLIQQLDQRRAMEPQAEAKQRRQALANLQAGIRSQPVDNERSQQLLLRIQQMLKADSPLEPADLKKLFDELQHFSVETSEQLAKKEDRPEVTNIDPGRLPAAYRGRIQKYFEKLSEK